MRRRGEAWYARSMAIFLTPLVVKILLPSSTYDYMPAQIAWHITEASQANRFFEVHFCFLAHFVNHPSCCARDLSPRPSGTHSFLQIIFSLFWEVPTRIWGPVRERVRVFPSGSPGCRRKGPGLRQPHVRLCPHPVSWLWIRATTDVFLQDTWILSLL